MKKLLIIILSVFLIVCTLLYLISKRNESKNFETDISIELLDAISLVIDDANLMKKSDDYFEDNYYLARFFKYENSDFLTIGVLGNFPLLCTQFKDKSDYYDYDFNLMYYFNVNGKNVIIMDYPKDAENPFFKKSKNRNMVIPLIKDFDTEKQFIGFKMSVLKTFVVSISKDTPKLIPSHKIILSPPYPSEISLNNIEIVDEN